MRLKLLILLTVLMYTGPAFAMDECNFNWMLANEDGSKVTKAQIAEKEEREKACRKRVAEEKKQANNARTRLKKEFKVDGSKMTDKEAIARLDEEVMRSAAARKEAEERRREAQHDKQVQHADELMKKQSDMLKGMGVNMGGGFGEGSDDEADAAELHAYQKMVDSGVAPKCKGKKGEALINCVDAELDKQQ